MLLEFHSTGGSGGGDGTILYGMSNSLIMVSQVFGDLMSVFQISSKMIILIVGCCCLCSWWAEPRYGVEWHKKW